MLTPDYLESCSGEIIKLYNQLELEIISQIARRIESVGYLNVVALDNVKIAQEMGFLQQDVINLLSKYMDKSEEEVKEIFKDAGVETLKFDDTIYREQGLNPIPIRQSKEMLQTILATAKKTNKNLNNLNMTTANNASNTFYMAINKAYLEVSSGAKNYNQAILDAVEESSKKGAWITYPSGKRRRLETAVRMNVVTGVNQTSAKLQEMRADEMGCDLMELTAHSGARPEHANWQGKIVSRSGKNKKHLNLKDIGYGTATGFKGVNCSHDWYPYYEGMTKTYSNKDIEEYNNQKVEYQDKEMTLYEAMQLQRKMERKIREDKRELIGLESILQNSKDDKLVEEAQKKYANKQIQYIQHKSTLNKFTKETGLKKDINRLKITSSTINKKSGIIKNSELAVPDVINKIVKEQKQTLNVKAKDFINKYLKNGDTMIDIKAKHALSYSKTMDKIVINNLHDDFKYYQIDESIVHEIVHMRDIREKIVVNNMELLEPILKKAEIYINNNNSFFNNFMNENKENMAFCDILSALSNGKLEGNFGHKSEYWLKNETKLNELAANIVSANLTDNKAVSKLLKEIPPLKDIEKEFIRLWGIGS